MPKPIKVEGRTGVFYRMAKRVGGPGEEKVYYVRFKRDGRIIEAKAGRQYKDNMTPAKAERYRSNLIEGREQTPKEKREAEKAAKKAESTRWTINKLWDDYCEKNVSNKGLHNEKFKYEAHIREGIGKKEPHELVPLDIDRLRLKLQKAGKKTMAARVLELIRRTVNYGVNKQLIEPIGFKIKPPTLHNETTETLTPEQLQKLHEALDAEKDQAAASVMRLALYTGMRKGEILKLKWVDLDFDRGFITIVDPKGIKDQTIPMNDMAREVLNSIDEDPDSDYLFPGRFGGYQKDFRKSFAMIREAAKLPEGFRPLHGLRHVFASNLASSGQVDMFTLSKLLTHKSDKMTRRYAHLADDALHRAASMAGDLMKPKKTKPVVKIRKEK
jgi:integrase